MAAEWVNHARRHEVNKEKIKESHETYERLEKAYKRWEQVNQAFEEEQRPGLIFDLGLEGAQKTIESLVGISIEWHPFWQWHKAHFEALKSVVEILASDAAMKEAFQKMIMLAVQTRTESEGYAEKYREKSQALANLKKTFGHLFVAASARANQQRQEIQRKEYSKVLTGGEALYEEILKTHALARKHVDDLISHWFALKQRRSAAAKLKASYDRWAGQLGKTRLRNLGRIAVSQSEGYNALEAYDATLDSQNMFMEFDRAIAEVERVITMWTDTMKEFDQALQKRTLSFLQILALAQQRERSGN